MYVQAQRQRRMVKTTSTMTNECSTAIHKNETEKSKRKKIIIINVEKKHKSNTQLSTMSERKLTKSTNKLSKGETKTTP